jgi:hypothetical protein
MKKLILLILLQTALLLALFGSCLGLAALALQLPNPVGIILTFLGWAGLGTLWQELAQRLPQRILP